jgi:hypothetical protein
MITHRIREAHCINDTFEAKHTLRNRNRNMNHGRGGRKFNTNPLGKLDPNGRPADPSALQLPGRRDGVLLPREAHEREGPARVTGDALDLAAPGEELREVGSGGAGAQAAHPQVPRRRRHAPPGGAPWWLVSGAVPRRAVAPPAAAESPPASAPPSAPAQLQEATNRD